MKVGDTLLCKNSSYPYVKDMSYPIIKIINEDLTWIYLTSCDMNIRFSLENDDFGLSYKDFFYTKEEIRKFKFESI